MRQTILWTALPNGISSDGGRLRLSVLASIRLETAPNRDATLGAFETVYNWPQNLPSFEVSFNGGAAVPAFITSQSPDANLWASVFDAATPVTSHMPEALHQRRIRSFPVCHVADFIRSHYARVGRVSPAEPPAVGWLVGEGLTEVLTFDSIESIREELDAEFFTGGERAIRPSPIQDETDFMQARVFHAPHGGRREVPLVQPQFDFHELLSLLGDHPTLLRRLGLLVDLEVPLDGQAAEGTVAVRRQVQVRPQPPRRPRRSVEERESSPLTRYRLDQHLRRFVIAAGVDSDLNDGWLRLDAERFSLQALDVDGAALKAIEFANHLAIAHSGVRASADSPGSAGLPALRSGGIAVVRTGRALSMVEGFDKSAVQEQHLTQNNGLSLDADDLTAGFRVDVQEVGGPWRSLCERDVNYHFLGRSGVEVPDDFSQRDEGTVTESVSESSVDSADPNQPNDLYCHEALFHWDGWSLAAPRLGGAVPVEGETPVETTANPSATSLNIEITARVAPGTLPRLRFGKTYRLRVRAVDVGGNSLALDEQEDKHASPPLTYRRFEPIEAPAVVLPPLPANFLSNGESVERLVIRSRNTNSPVDGVVSPERAVRWVVPPKASVSLAEQCGMLDLPNGGVDASRSTWEMLAAKDAGSLDLHGLQALPTVPYLPDPMAKGATVNVAPGNAQGETITVSFQTDEQWWAAQAFRIILAEGTEQDGNPPVWDAQQRILTVYLGKGQITRIRISSQPHATDLDRMAIWDWLEQEAFDADEILRLRKLAEIGGHWMLTPYRELTLVHAVQQPLMSPVIQALTAQKHKGETFARLQGEVYLHASSTAKLDLYAQWYEWTGFGMDRNPVLTHVREVAVDNPTEDRLRLAALQQEFGDTKYRRLRYTAKATTRFREYFSAAETRDPDSLVRVTEAPFEAEVLSSARPLAPKLLYIVPTFAWESSMQDNHAISRRRSGLRIYLKPPWFSSGEGELLGVVLSPGPADACGTSPKNEVTNDDIEKLRHTLEVDEVMKPYVTQWGRDPIWLSGPTHSLPGLHYFPSTVAMTTDCLLEELTPPASVAVAGHTVGYDEERKLFYCDIEIDAGASYYPFVRLALARYQPKSLKGVELSRVVLADYAQFAPDRMAWVTRDPEEPANITVSVSGSGYRANASFACASTLEVRLERWLGPDQGAIGWVPASASVVRLENVQSTKSLGVWSGRLQLPSLDDRARYRVVIEEFECFLGDVPEAQPGAEAGAAFGQGEERRLVYADAVEI